MSAVPKPAEQQREMTDEDFNALMKSEVWLSNQKLDYERMWVAVLGERIIATDPDRQELYRRLVAMGDTIDRYKVLIRYYPGWNEFDNG
jgi:hypothetical protein